MWFIRDWGEITTCSAFVAIVKVFEYHAPIEAISAGDVFPGGKCHLWNITAVFFAFV